MNFEFSEESTLLRDQAGSFLRRHCGAKTVRNVLEGQEPYAKSLWQEIAALGWCGAAIPEEYGGTGLGYESLCVLAEEFGRVLAPVPFASSIFLASELIKIAGSTAQKKLWLPRLADGSRIGTFALMEGLGQPDRENISAEVAGGILNGTKWPVPNGTVSDFVIVAARDASGVGLYHVELGENGAVQRRGLHTVDPSRLQAELIFANAVAERLGGANDHWSAIEQVLARAAILVAFEQVGGAEACLHMARDYALDRFAFGRPIASFQAIKHRLADIYVDIEIARSNAYYGVWALGSEAADIQLAAAAARVAATHAFWTAAKESIQIHGGAGFTWEFDCHLYYRRAKLLAVALGGAPFWSDRLVQRLMMRQTDAENRDGL
jgi:acyl-CoA dehydrogenase